MDKIVSVHTFKDILRLSGTSKNNSRHSGWEPLLYVMPFMLNFMSTSTKNEAYLVFWIKGSCWKFWGDSNDSNKLKKYHEGNPINKILS